MKKTKEKTKAKSSPESLTTSTSTMAAISSKALQYGTLLDNLKLNPDSKLTLKNARTVDNHTLKDDKLTSPDQIPEYILKTLMIVNYHAREFDLKCVRAEEDIAEDSDSDDSAVEHGINPMDALLAIFHCSDDLLRRDIAIKLSACQLSVPFLLPDPEAPPENLTMLLSALESIMKSWKGTFDSSQGAQQVFATEHPFPVVSFIRIGKNSMSKSSLINRIISGGSGAHDVFFHKDMKGGNIERKLVDGLVELSWYLPGGIEEQTLEKEICFANLRGDGRDFKKQLDFMLKISSLFCLLLTSECPDEATKTILDNAMSSQTNLILIFNDKTQQDAKKYFSNLRDSNRQRVTLITRAIKANEYDFVRSLRQKIQKNINAVKPVPLVEFGPCAGEYDIHVDSGQSRSRFDERVETWLKLGAKDAKDLLKLQTYVPVLADLEREIYCPRRKNESKGKRIDRGTDEIHADVEKERESQKKSFNDMDKRISQCLNDIAVMDERDRSYALTKLKHQLNKMSLHTMAILHEEYHVASMNLQKKRQGTPETSEAPSSEEEQVKKLEESISKCSFGLEHIIRELAQLYQLSDFSTNDYAGAAAEMLLSGHPLELVDGDSSYIPLRWFDAVYTKLEQKTNNANIFVISVLGIQSSGKSTMLNTMFGLEFPVSAGRCTSGAFASLIPVSDSPKFASNFDFILIIDTEGLRGSGDPELREHDNELATFAIGVADVTIVNIFGENHNEMKEFLEIAVHAFLKMKLVKEKKVCKIVHQNVAATDATTKLAVDRVKLKEDLDKMAKVAATQENCEDQFQKLNHIISFDENKDVFYIPSLLKGSPPMAPVSPNYGRAIEKVKEDIISLMCASSLQTVSQFRERVDILWKAMLKENFIFSFRNTIEVRAYTSLDRKYFEEYVNLMVIGMAELERKIQISLSRSTTREERRNRWRASEMQIRDEAESLKKKLEEAMEHFFETNEDKVTLEQWRENVMNRIVQHKENQVNEVTRNCSATFHYLQDRQDVDERRQIYEKQLLEKARQFITSRPDMESASRSKEAFEQEWKQWIEEVPRHEETKVNVNEEMVHVLCNADSTLNTDMLQKLKSKDCSIIQFKEILLVVDTQLNISYVGHVINFIAQHQHQCLSDASIIRDQAVNEGNDFAHNKSKEGVRCRRSDLTQMCNNVITTINEKTKNRRFKFKKSLICDILLYIFANAYETFEKMEERYFEERDIRGDLERNLRPKLQKYFLNLCSKMENDVLAATSIVDVLQKPIESELNRTMGPVVAREILKTSEFQSKGKFHATVLIQLGQEGKFESYISYLENPVEFLRKKLMESIENFCLKYAKTSVNLLLNNEAEKIENQVFMAISTATDKLTKSGNNTLTFWIQRFVEDCSTLEITKEMFAVAAIDDELQDIGVFVGKVREHVAQFIRSLINRELDCAAMDKWNPSPHDQLFTSMFGCQNYCPFCKALCDQTVENHAGSHATRIHRPNCLNGFRCAQTGILVSDICTTLVAGKRTFLNAETSNGPHPYKDYKSVNEYYHSWSIPPDSFEASNYWQWFVATFERELAEHYKAKQPEIPLAWKLLSFREIKKKLQHDYKL